MSRLKFGFIPIEGGHYYREALEEVERAEDARLRLGLDGGAPRGHRPLLARRRSDAGGFATRTSRVRSAPTSCVAPFYHPVRLAEDAAMLDVISSGRFVLGHRDRLQARRVRPLRRRAREARRALRGAARDHEGPLDPGRRRRSGASTTRCEGRLEPKPVQRPHPPVWIGGWGDVTLRRAALLADAWVPGPTADLGRLLAGQAKFREHRGPPGSPEPVRVAADPGALHRRDRARGARARRAAPDARLPARSTAGRGSTRSSTRRPPTDLDALTVDRFLIGGPDRSCETSSRSCAEYGMTHVIFRLFFPACRTGTSCARSSSWRGRSCPRSGRQPARRLPGDRAQQHLLAERLPGQCQIQADQEGPTGSLPFTVKGRNLARQSTTRIAVGRRGSPTGSGPSRPTRACSRRSTRGTRTGSSAESYVPAAPPARSFDLSWPAGAAIAVVRCSKRLLANASSTEPILDDAEIRYVADVGSPPRGPVARHARPAGRRLFAARTGRD